MTPTQRSGSVPISPEPAVLPAGNRNATAQLFRCANDPSAAPGSLASAGSIDSTSAFGGNAIVIAQRACVPIRCE